MTQLSLFPPESPAPVIPHRFCRTCPTLADSLRIALAEYRSRRWSEVLIGPGQPDEPHQVVLS